MLTKNVRWCWLALLALVLATRGSAEELMPPGAFRADVITKFGVPIGKVSLGGKEVLTYPQGRITLVDGVVTTSESATAMVHSAASVPLVSVAAKVAPQTGWLGDFEQAKARAATLNKPLLFLLTGNMDQCPWGRQFNESIQSNQGFVRKASADFVLLRINLSEIAGPDENGGLEEFKRWEAGMNELMRVRKIIFSTEMVPSLAVLTPDASQSAEVDMSGALHAQDMFAYTWSAVLAAREAPKKEIPAASHFGSFKVNWVYVGFALVVIGVIAKRLNG